MPTRPAAATSDTRAGTRKKVLREVHGDGERKEEKRERSRGRRRFFLALLVDFAPSFAVGLA